MGIWGRDRELKTRSGRGLQGAENPSIAILEHFAALFPFGGLIIKFHSITAIIPTEIFSALISMAFSTTIIAPIVFRNLIKQKAGVNN